MNHTFTNGIKCRLLSEEEIVTEDCLFSGPDASHFFHGCIGVPVIPNDIGQKVGEIKTLVPKAFLLFWKPI